MAPNKELIMLMRTFLAVVMAAGGCLGQKEAASGTGAAEPRYFHLDFVVKEVEGGKTINTRSYAMTVTTDRERASIRSGNRVPVPSGPRPAPGTQSVPFTFVDVGTSIDCWNSRELQGQLALMVSAEVSSASEVPDAPAPVIRQVKWASPVIVPLRKPTVIFSSDDPSSKRQMQLELTAIPIK
jgi:hypothetical protein